MGPVLATLHLLALGIGFGFAWMRARALLRVRTTDDLQDVFFADNLYGLATLLWIGTGLLRAFGGWEKGSEYYLHSDAFWAKMSLFMGVFALEVYPMIQLIRWRIKLSKGQDIVLVSTRIMGLMTYAEVILMTAMVFVAVLMARGLWF